MTINNNKQKFQDDLSISRNKAEFFIENYLNAVVDAFLGEEELVLPLNSARLGCLEYSKNAEKFGKDKDHIIILKGIQKFIWN